MDLESAVRKHGEMLYRICIVILGSEQDTQDAIQETFCKYLEKNRNLWTASMKMQKYRLFGILLLAGTLCLTGCGGSTDPKADVMEGEVQQPMMQEDSADSAYRVDDDTVPEENSKNPVLPPLSAEAQTIDYKGSIPIDYLTASADAVYLVSRDQDGDSKS